MEFIFKYLVQYLFIGVFVLCVPFLWFNYMKFAAYKMGIKDWKGLQVIALFLWPLTVMILFLSWAWWQGRWFIREYQNFKKGKKHV